MRQAKSKQKILDKMEAAGLTKPVRRERTFVFTFPECEKLPPPVLPFVDVSFAYSGKEEDMLYRVGSCTQCYMRLHASVACMWLHHRLSLEYDYLMKGGILHGLHVQSCTLPRLQRR